MVAKKTVGYVHLVWRCPNCSQFNPGPEKTCETCGSPQPEDVQFENPPKQEISKDESLAKEVRKGADIHCPYCHTRNEGDAVTCIQCGGDLVEGKQREKGRILRSPDKTQPGEQTCPACGTVNTAGNLRCNSCGGSLAKQAPKVSSTEVQKPQSLPVKKSPIKKIGLVALFLVLGVICITAIALLTRTSEVVGTVSGLSWKRSISIEQIQPVMQEGWFDSIPSEAENITCTQKYYDTRDYPSTGSVEVCGTPYTVDTGTGIGEVVQDCQYEIYKDYCEYTVMDWTEVNVVQSAGQDLNVYWPELSLSSNQRQGSMDEDYVVSFSTEKGILQYKTSDSSDFLLFALGSEWILEVNSLGGISGYQQR